MAIHAHMFEIIAEEAIMGIVAFSEDTYKCAYINRLAREILGVEVPADDAEIPLNLLDLYVDEDRPAMGRAFKPEMIRHEGMHQDILLKKLSGSMLLANVGIKHVMSSDTGESLVMVMFQDISIQKKLQREVLAKQEVINKSFVELLEQNKQLKELDLAKDKFFALMTHELRTPLSAIVATAEVLTLNLTETEQQKTDFIKTIHEQGLHLMDLINDVLDFAKIRAGKMEFFVEEIDLLPLIEKMVANFDHMASHANVKMVVEKPAAEIKGWVDVMRMKEVINNVVNNAIKYNRDGGSVHVTVHVDSGKARVTVRDTGPGIPQDKIKHVFNEFETVGNLSKHHKGTGLGMPISKKLMMTMGGDLTLTSEVGVGSSFYIDIPVTKVLSEEMYGSRPDMWGDLAA